VTDRRNLASPRSVLSVDVHSHPGPAARPEAAAAATGLHAHEVLGSGARLLIPGLVVGSLLAATAARLVQAAFVGVNVLNPLTYLAVALLECVIVIAACISPALRASRADPLVALRAE
jgi:putative ABC transport system permease protein